MLTRSSRVWSTMSSAYLTFTVYTTNHDRRTLESIAAFTQERAGRSRFDQMRKKQSDADDIKKWEKQLTRAYERFSVSSECLHPSHAS
jgi:hypothetical protein